MARQVIDGAWVNLQLKAHPEEATSAVNVKLGEDAITMFRQDLGKSVQFEKDWFDSGMATVISWLVTGTSSSSQGVKQSVADLINLTLDTVSQRLQQDESQKHAEAAKAAVSITTLQDLDRSVTVWAENAHTELRDRLDAALHRKVWTKTRWWKLLWRVDEVGFNVCEILEQAWLVDAEKELIWISGRIHESGLLGSPTMRRRPAEEADAPMETQPWARDLEFSRSALIRNSVPPLQALAQKLLLQSVSTTVLASTFSALIYVSVSTTSAFEAGAVAALGLVYSLRRLQKRWETARRTWQEAIRENGRDTLRRCEDRLRGLIQGGGTTRLADADLQVLDSARKAVQQARDDLNVLCRDRKQ